MKAKEQIKKEFEEVVRPVIKFLNDNYHPHSKIIIDTMAAEIVEGCLVFDTEVEGCLVFDTEDYLVD